MGVELEDEEIRRCILQVLYPEANTMEEVRDVPEEELSARIGVDLVRVRSNLMHLMGSGLVEAQERGVRLSEKAIWAITQHDRTYCPYL